MPNPWLKKNPFMSMWLSAANRAAGTVRAQATAEVKRQLNAATAKATRDSLKALSGDTKPVAAKPRRKR